MGKIQYRVNKIKRNMAKTVFSSGVVITSKWLNGSQNISFDGADEDWHYPPLTSDSVKLSGDGGFDGVFMTLATSQLATGAKEFSNTVTFTGLDVTEGSSPVNAPGQTEYWSELIGSNDIKLTQMGDGVVTGTILNSVVQIIDGGEI